MNNKERQSATVQELNRMSWETAIELEPRLLALHEEIREHDFSWHHYEIMKSRLRQLAGWYAEKPELRTSTAYEICLNKMLDGWEGESND